MTSNRSFTGDLLESFRWIADVAVMDAFESRVLDLPDFYFTGDDYKYRFELEAKQRFLDLLRERFNSGVRYKGRALKLDTVVEQKAAELGRFLIGRTGNLDFSEPSPSLERADDLQLRRRILSLSQQEGQSRGIGKNTLHSIRKRAKDSKPLKVYEMTLYRLRIGHAKSP